MGKRHRDLRQTKVHLSLNRKQNPKVEKEMDTEMEDASGYEDFSFGSDSSPLEDFNDKYPFHFHSNYQRYNA